MIVLYQNKPAIWQNKPVTKFIDASGSITAYDGDYATHTFLSSGKFTVITPGIVELILVGGGGGGKKTSSCISDTARGGGGGGGEVIVVNTKLNIGTYDVSIGAGGEWGYNGGPSYFGSLYCASGGFSSNTNDHIGGNSGNGFAGVTGNPAIIGGWAGGGGGAGGAGSGTNGGIGVHGFGGGGGGALGGIGVDGGGSAAAYPTFSTDASENTGGGGGGGICQPSGSPFASVDAGKGGSGIAIIRYKYK